MKARKPNLARSLTPEAAEKYSTGIMNLLTKLKNLENENSMKLKVLYKTNYVRIYNEEKFYIDLCAAIYFGYDNPTNNPFIDKPDRRNRTEGSVEHIAKLKDDDAALKIIEYLKNTQ